MKKNNSFILLTLALIASGCTKKAPESLISKWEKKTDSIPVVERKMASAPQGQCLKDIFSVETLKAEMFELEKKYAGGKKVTGQWKHLDLSGLPVPQANFLKTFGEKIGNLSDPDSIDYSSCEDLPCIFNKIYGKENHVAGYVHYIWYLKFGHMLSADNLIPNQSSKIAGEFNGKAMPLSSYLYNDKELFGLWRLSHMLKTPHTTLSYLKEVQRVPRGEDFEGEDYKGACGLAQSSGWITLNDGCLTVYGTQDDSGYLYQAVTHELTHHIDFEQGRGTTLFYRSHKPDYLEIAGMYLNEYVDANGKNVRQWAHKPGIKLMTSYAGSAPQENFAESISVFRTDGNLARKNVTEDHFNFVSNNYYQSRSFEKEAQMKTWISAAASETGKSVFKAVVDCSKDSSGPKSTYFKASDFSAPVLPGMLNCFGNRATEISNILRGRSALYEPDGCMVLNDYNTKGKWDIHMKDHLRGAFDKYLQELQKDKDYLARIQIYYEQLSDKRIAREAYVNCFGESNEEQCFQEEIKKNAYEKALTLKLPPEQTQEMADMYVSYHSYDVIRDETKKQYQTFVSSNLETVRKEADETWEGCKSIPHNDDQSPTGNLFTVGDGYMISSFYNCLNSNIPDAIKETVRNLSVDGVKVQNAKEEIILSKEVQPHLVGMLKEKYLAEREEEVGAAIDFMANENGELGKQLLSNFDWVKNVVDADQIMSDCKKEGYRIIKFDALYNTKAGLFGNYLETKSCVKIPETPEFNNWLNNSKDVFNQKVSDGLDEKINAIAIEVAEACLVQYPMNNAINKIRWRKQREACLLDEWPKMEAKVLDQVMSDPLVIKFQMSRETLKKQLEANRRVLQLRVMKEYFN